MLVYSKFKIHYSIKDLMNPMRRDLCDDVYCHAVIKRVRVLCCDVSILRRICVI